LKKKNETEKVCPCGRIITDPKNKIGLCPMCQKKAGSILVGALVTGVIAVVKEYGSILINQLKKS
jgi:hypothetical protein